MATSIEKTIADMLFRTAVDAAAGTGRTFKQSAAGGLRELAAAAATEVLEPGRFGERSDRARNLDLAERQERARSAMKTLVAEMGAHAVALRGYPPDRLGERTLAHTMYSSRFCPCWPFC